MATQEQPQSRTLNGVDIGAVQDAVKMIQDDAEVAKFRFRLHNHWIDGARNRAEVNDFYGARQTLHHQQRFEWMADEPPLLAGNDSAPNPVEHLLNALSSCLTTTMVYHAALRGIRIEELESELEGDIDLRGFLGLTNEVRRGYENIRVTFRVKTDEENLERLKALSKLSPVYDVTSNGTNVDLQIERKQ